MKKNDEWYKTDGGNYVLAKHDANTKEYFYISYNPNPPAADTEETALCVDDEFYVLDGDFRKLYEPLITKEACLEVYYKYKEHARSEWSTEGNEDTFNVDKLGLERVRENIEKELVRVTKLMEYLKNLKKDRE